MMGLPDATQRALNRTRTEVIASTSDNQEYVIPNLSGSAKLKKAQIEGNLAVDENTLYVDAENGRVGIGTTTPGSPLDLFNASGATVLRISRAIGSNYVAFTTPGGSPNSLTISGNTSVGMHVYTGSGSGVAEGDIRIGNVLLLDRSVQSAIFSTTLGVAGASALVQIDSTTKGFLPPRMTTTQKGNISSPATGLVVYDTDLNKLCVYTGSAWETVTSA